MIRRFILANRIFWVAATVSTRRQLDTAYHSQLTGFVPGLLALALLIAALGFAIPQPVFAQSSPELRDDRPDRYVVERGDTLWSIANRFLKDPWRWPLIWESNPNVENPHLIFPGDLLVVTSQNNIKVVRLKPKVRRSQLDRGIPAIPPNVIQPFLTSPLIIEPGELDDSGYVLQGVDDELILGKYDQLYSRGLKDLEARNIVYLKLMHRSFTPKLASCWVSRPTLRGCPHVASR